MSLVAQMLHYQREDTVQRIFMLVSKEQSGLQQGSPSFHPLEFEQGVCLGSEG